MSLAIKYESVDDARLRLRQTVVLYKGAPVLITDVLPGGNDGPFRVLMKELPVGKADIPQGNIKRHDPFRIAPPEPIKLEGEETQRKYISSKHFDIAPFRMGYVNHPKLGAFYCSRMPNRVQKQGLCGDNFHGVFHSGEKVSFNTFLSCKETLEMVSNVYPTFDRACALLDKVPSIAFARDFAVARDEVIPKLIYLFYKGTKVGMWSNSEVTLGKKFACLKESLNEMKLKVGVC